MCGSASTSAGRWILLFPSVEARSRHPDRGVRRGRFSGRLPCRPRGAVRFRTRNATRGRGTPGLGPAARLPRGECPGVGTGLRTRGERAASPARRRDRAPRSSSRRVDPRSSRRAARRDASGFLRRRWRRDLSVDGSRRLPRGEPTACRAVPRGCRALGRPPNDDQACRRPSSVRAAQILLRLVRPATGPFSDGSVWIPCSRSSPRSDGRAATEVVRPVSSRPLARRLC